MANTNAITRSDLQAKRDAKASQHLQQYAPVWIVDEQFVLEEDAVQFNVVFLHPHAGPNQSQAWVNRRYRYDGFNNTLYHKGQRLLDEDVVVEITQKDPYLNATISDTPNSYGG